ncbi:LysE/ArgO family amino acid transporter [Colwellia maritima]|nr:LysE/ArgO family amino acid transporter [Colwellia maritima]
MIILAALKGFTLSLSMIIPIGSQNSMLLSQGINKNHHLMTAGLFILYDAFLISLGVLGGNLILSANPLLFTLLTWGGILFLFTYGALSFKAAIDGIKTGKNKIQTPKSWKIIFVTSLVVTFLNPHAYIDTVMVIGSVGGQYSGEAQIYFLMGAIAASIVWFSTLAFSAAKLSVYLSKPKIKSIIDSMIGLVMWFIAWSLFMTWLET